MIRLGLLQLTSSEVPEDNLLALLSYAEQAVSYGAQYIFSPECSNVMDMNRHTILRNTFSQKNDPMIMAVQDFCRAKQVTFFLGSVVVKVADQRLANRSLVIGPQGNIMATYDKIHLFDVSLPNGEVYKESRLYDAGDQVTFLQTDDFCAGLSICYDVRFPYLYQKLAHKGVDLLAVPAAFTVPTGQAHWHCLLRARAIENGCYVVAAAQSGFHQTGRMTYGHSVVISPWGDIAYDAGGPDWAHSSKVQSHKVHSGCHIVDIDMANVHKVRQKIPSLQHSVEIS